MRVNTEAHVIQICVHVNRPLFQQKNVNAGGNPGYKALVQMPVNAHAFRKIRCFEDTSYEQCVVGFIPDH